MDIFVIKMIFCLINEVVWLNKKELSLFWFFVFCCWIYVSSMILMLKNIERIILIVEFFFVFESCEISWIYYVLSSLVSVVFSKKKGNDFCLVNKKVRYIFGRVEWVIVLLIKFCFFSSIKLFKILFVVFSKSVFVRIYCVFGCWSCSYKFLNNMFIFYVFLLVFYFLEMLVFFYMFFVGFWL